jgi:hypothetical protein
MRAHTARCIDTMQFMLAITTDIYHNRQLFAAAAWCESLGHGFIHSQKKDVAPPPFSSLGRYAAPGKHVVRVFCVRRPFNCNNHCSTALSSTDSRLLCARQGSSLQQLQSLSTEKFCRSELCSRAALRPPLIPAHVAADLIPEPRQIERWIVIKHRRCNPVPAAAPPAPYSGWLPVLLLLLQLLSPLHQAAAASAAKAAAAAGEESSVPGGQLIAHEDENFMR